MRDRKKKRAKYAALGRKIYLRIGLIAFAAFIIIVVLRELVKGRAGDWIVSFLRNVFGISAERAAHLYQQVIRNYLEQILFASMIVCFIILARYLISQFSKYFHEIDAGLDGLVGNKGDAIKLSYEMASMESKLISIQNTLRQREREAQLAERRKNDVVMYLAHDIKTPLTSVIGYLSLLDEIPDMESGRKAKYVRVALEKGRRLEKLVDEFFEITRYQFQTVTLRAESIDLYTMMAQMTDEFYPLLAAKGKRVALHVPEDMRVYGDPDKLARVFGNILKNAVSYSPDNSGIEITASTETGKATIAFQNSGSISKEDLTSVFDKFIRLDSARSANMGGTGLGLAIAKEIVVLHGGRIGADSDGKNTTFTVELPSMPDQL